jgi:ceramide glucosyltransferase
MILAIAGYIFLAVAAIPFVYYLIVIYSSLEFFAREPGRDASTPDFTPAVSILKPIRGLDPEEYENFASFCRQDYPDYEIVFCVGESDDPALTTIGKLARDFPDRSIRVLFGSGSRGANDKVAKLARLVAEARHEYLVINDSDVRVSPDYLRTVVTPLADPNVGAVTCFYVSTSEKTFAERLHTIGMVSDFYAGILVARKLDGVKFALGPTIGTTRGCLTEFGGYQSIENQPADDLLVGRLIADRGKEVRLLPYAIQTVADFGSLRQLFQKRLRWIVVMRHLRPWGHLGLLLTQGLLWSVLAIAIHPSPVVVVAYLGTYTALRIVMTWIIGIHGLKQARLWRNFPLIPVWDGLALLIWLVSFSRKSIRWRDTEYCIRDGALVPVTSNQGDD